MLQLCLLSGLQLLQVLCQLLCLLLVLLCCFLGLLDALLQLSDLLGELLLNIIKLLSDILELLIQIILLLLFGFVLSVQRIQLLLVLFLSPLEFIILLVDHLFLFFDSVTLVLDCLVELSTLRLLLITVVLHVFDQVLLDLLDVLNLNLLLFEQVLGLFKLLVLVSESVDLSLKLVRLLLLNHLDITIGNLLDLGKARVAETVTLQTDVDQSCVLVQCFKHHSLNGLREEVVSKFDLTDALVVLQGIDQVHKARVVQTARGEVESLKLGGTLSVISRNHSGKETEDLVTEEVLVAHQCLQVGQWEYFAESLETLGTDLVQGDVQLFDCWGLSKRLSQQDHALVADNVALDVQRLQRVVLCQALGNALGTLDHQLIELEVELLDRLRLLQQLLEWLSHIRLDVVLGQ